MPSSFFLSEEREAVVGSDFGGDVTCELNNWRFDL
jgi:hypothetical protein